MCESFERWAGMTDMERDRYMAEFELRSDRIGVDDPNEVKP